MAAVGQIQWDIEVSDLRIWAACRVTNLHHKQFITWKQDIVRMQQKRKKQAKIMCLGPSSIRLAFEDQLLHYISELWERGMAVSSRLVIIEATSLCRDFRPIGISVGSQKTRRRTRYVSIQYFMTRACLSYHVCHSNNVHGDDQGFELK